MTHTPDEAAARENLELGLANNHRTATPLEASAAKMALMAMRSHRGDGMPTQYVHGAEVAAHAETMWLALLTAIRAASQAELKAEVGEDVVERVAWAPDLHSALVDTARQLRHFWAEDSATGLHLHAADLLDKSAAMFATIRREAFDEAARVFNEGLASQAQRLGIIPTEAESPGRHRDRTRPAAIRALSDQPIDDISDTGAEVEREGGDPDEKAPAA